MVDDALTAARGRLDAARKQAVPAGEDAAKSAPADRLPTFEGSLKAENDHLAAAKDQLQRLTAGREDAIRAAIDRAPDHVARDDGILARIMALEAIAQSDTKIMTVIILIDVTSFGLELAAVRAKVTSFQPTTYAALIARDAYLRALHIADEINREIELSMPAFDAGQRYASPGAPGGFNGFAFKVDDDDDEEDEEEGESPAPPPPDPPKRPRGRPRKQPPP